MKPMLAQMGNEQFLEDVERDPDWVSAEKWEGIRILLYLNNSSNRVLTRSGKDSTKNVPRLQTIVTELNGTILDSEGVAPTGYLGDAQTIFNSSPGTAIAWQEANGHATLILFDCLKYRGQPINHLSFKERRPYLTQAYRILRRYKFPVKLELLKHRNKRQHYKNIIRSGGEGVMIKDLLAPYTPGKRTRAWVKVKPRNTYDFIILGFTQGTGKYSNQIGAIKYGAYYEGKLTEVGKSSGMTDKERLDMTNHPGKYIKKVAEFEAQEIFKSGAMRHPEYIQLRPDKKPNEIHLEDYL